MLRPKAGARWLPTLTLLALSLLAPGSVLAQATGGCAAGQSPRFTFGFADLKSHIGEAMGDPLTCEFSDPNGSGDVHQRTTTGLAFWRKSTNTPTFTNGFDHWANTPSGWVTWTGASIDPPGAAAAYPPIIVNGFMSGCTAGDADREPVCRCAIGKIQDRYSLTDFINLAQRLQNGEPTDELTPIVIECLVQTE